MRRLRRRNMGAVDDPIATTETEIASNTWMMPSTTAIQIYGIIPGIAGGVAGFILAQKLADYPRVSTQEVILSSGLVALVTLGSLFLIRTVSSH